MNTAPHLLLLCFLKLGGSVIVMKDRNYEAVNTTHTKLSFKMTSRGRFGLASSQDQAMMRSGLCKVQHHTCPKSLCGEVEFTSTLRNKIIEITTKLSPCLEYKGVRIEAETRSDSKSPESWMEGGWEGELGNEEQVNSLM